MNGKDTQNLVWQILFYFYFFFKENSSSSLHTSEKGWKIGRGLFVTSGMWKSKKGERGITRKIETDVLLR